MCPTGNVQLLYLAGREKNCGTEMEKVVIDKTWEQDEMIFSNVRSVEEVKFYKL